MHQYLGWPIYFLYIFGKTLLAFLAFAALLHFVFPRIWPGAFERNSDKHWYREFWLSVFNLAMWSTASTLIVFTSYEYGYPDISGVQGMDNDYIIEWIYYPFWFVFMLLMVDTMFYVVHRLLHHQRVFKWAHYTHHKFTEPTGLSGYSFHLLEGFLLSLFTVSLPYAMMPFTLETCWIFNLFAVIWAVVLHSGLRTDGWHKHPVLRFLNSPSHHRQHHQTGRQNYGLYFSFWDKALGTEQTSTTK